MAQYLKRGKDADVRAAEDAKVREIVEATLADIEQRGDAAVRELSNKFDSFDRDSYRLTDDEIQACLAAVPERDLDDLKFAQEQVRKFAEHQRACLTDLELET